MAFLKFTYPHLLWLLLGVPFLVLLRLYSNWQKRKAITRLGNPELVVQLFDSVDPRRRRWKTWLFILGYALLVFAMSGPQVGTKIAYAKREGLDILIALDTSLSMQAEDVAPNRFAKAKHEIGTLLNQLDGDRVGLIAFAGSSFVQCPLTTDYSALNMFLDILSVQSIPQQGSILTDAIRTAIDTFKRQQDKKEKPPVQILLLVTDGETHDPNLDEVLQEAMEAGIRIFAIGLGQVQPGSPIPLYDRRGQRVGYKKDRQGGTVITRLEETTLQRLTLATQGRYYRATPSEDEVSDFYDAISELERRQLEERQYTAYENRGFFFLLLAGLCLVGEWMLTDRRKGQAQCSTETLDIRSPIL